MKIADVYLRILFFKSCNETYRVTGIPFLAFLFSTPLLVTDTKNNAAFRSCLFSCGSGYIEMVHAVRLRQLK